MVYDWKTCMNSDGNLIQILQCTHDAAFQKLKSQIIALEETAWPSAPEEEPIYPVQPNTFVTAFVIIKEGKAIGQVAIRKQSFSHKGTSYLAYGISEMVTHPAYQKQGLGTQLLQKVATFIEGQKPDICIFTCRPELIPFYKKGGFWFCEKLFLVGGTPENPFPSQELGLCTMLRLYSKRAIINKAGFAQGEIFLNLGDGQLW